jgi:DNA-binding response OmpR family regulator
MEGIALGREMGCLVVIEDNPGDLLMIREAVSHAGFKGNLIAFDDGPPAIAGLCPADAVIRPDAILLDVRLKSTDGLNVLRQIRSTAHLANIPVAILTSSRAEADEQQALSLRAKFIPKPFKVDEFLNTIGRIVQQMIAAK